MVLELSSDEATFRESPPKSLCYDLDVRKRKSLILDLLRKDPHLKRAHAKLANRLTEDVFWTNYFYHCALLRRVVGLDPEPADKADNNATVVTPDHTKKKHQQPANQKKTAKSNREDPLEGDPVDVSPAAAAPPAKKPGGAEHSRKATQPPTPHMISPNEDHADDSELEVIDKPEIDDDFVLVTKP
mmetsp:Transcript_14064/g.45920  ORF Transcript_14064/g.45920 Transcript_14064/m.45920 type:complete len:186 (+) Transcript_14064:604-1161(+)